MKVTVNFYFKIVATFFLYLIVSAPVYSQESELIKSGKDITSQKRQEFIQAINREFTKAITGTGFSNLGNYAAISTDAKSFTFSGNLVSKNTIIGIEIAGGATEGVLKLLTNDELNSNISGELKVHKLFKVKEPSLNYLEGFKIENQIEELNIKYHNEINEILKFKDFDKLKLEIESGKARLIELRRNSLVLDSLANTTGITLEEKNRLEYELVILKLGIENLENILNIQNSKLKKIEVEKEDYLNNLLEISKQKNEEENRILKNKLLDRNLQSYEFTWYSIGFRAKNNNLKLFSDENLLVGQFSDTSFVSQRLSASISKFIKTPFSNNEIFWSMGLFVNYTTNLSALKNIEIEERVGVSGNPQQDIVRKISAYQGDYLEGLLDFSIFYDYYRFFGFQDSKFGIHLNPSFNYSEFMKSHFYSLYLGLIFPFVEKEKQVSSINLELFYNNLDLLNSSNGKIDNSKLGVRLAIPLSKLNK